MKKKFSKGMLLVGLLTTVMSITAFAGQWKSDANGWWWDNGDGTWPASSWQWLDGNNDGKAECYYFNANGYMAANTVIDGYTVNTDGAWLENGSVQVKSVAATQEINIESAHWSKQVIDLINPKYLDIIGKDIAYAKNVLGVTLYLDESSSFGDTLWYTDAKDILDSTTYLIAVEKNQSLVHYIASMADMDVLKNAKTSYSYEELCQIFGEHSYEYKSDVVDSYDWNMDLDATNSGYSSINLSCTRTEYKWNGDISLSASLGVYK